jgi:arylsulfatase A-like enzyme
VGVERRVWEVRGQRLAGKIEDEVTMRNALEWIHQDTATPFFLYLNLQNSHFPYRLPGHVPPTYHPVDITGYASTFWYPRELAAVMENRYDNSLLYVDTLLDTLVQALEADGLLDRTILIVTGDTGQAFHEHGTVTHASHLWNEVLRVPLILHAPGFGAETVEHPVQHIDIPPTVLFLLGLPPHPAFQGVNMFDAEACQQRSLFALAQSPLADESAVDREGYKLLSDWRTGTYALFDLRRDPGETVNLLKQEPALFEALRQRLDQWHFEQLFYYATSRLHQRFYPPVFE